MKTNPIDLLEQVRRLGVELVVQGQALRYHPSDGLPAELVHGLRACREEVLAILRTEHACGEHSCEGTDSTDRASGGPELAARCAQQDLGNPTDKADKGPGERLVEDATRAEALRGGTDKTDKTLLDEVLSVLSVSGARAFDAEPALLEAPWIPAGARRCYACGRSRWWRLERLSTGEPGDWVCGTCHPPEPGAQIDLKSEDVPPGQPGAQPHRSTARPPAFWDGYLESGSGTGGGW